MSRVAMSSPPHPASSALLELAVLHVVLADVLVPGPLAGPSLLFAHLELPSPKICRNRLQEPIAETAPLARRPGHPQGLLAQATNSITPYPSARWPRSHHN